MPQQAEQSALRWIEGRDDWSVRASLEQSFAGDQIQFPLGLFSAMTCQTVVFKSGLHRGIKSSQSARHSFGMIWRQGSRLGSGEAGDQ